MTLMEDKTPEKLSADSIARQVLEAAALRLEDMAGNHSYVHAWRKAARIIRSMKPD